jgi:hypothetical protein
MSLIEMRGELSECMTSSFVTEVHPVREESPLQADVEQVSLFTQHQHGKVAQG